MFQFRRFPTYAYLIQRTLLEYCSSGFPHSEISGSMLICSSPKLIAACHVLHRLLMPRHSPCALYSLTFGWSNFAKSTAATAGSFPSVLRLLALQYTKYSAAPRLALRKNLSAFALVSFAPFALSRIRSFLDLVLFDH